MSLLVGFICPVNREFWNLVKCFQQWEKVWCWTAPKPQASVGDGIILSIWKGWRPFRGHTTQSRNVTIFGVANIILFQLRKLLMRLTYQLRMTSAASAGPGCSIQMPIARWTSRIANCLSRMNSETAIGAACNLVFIEWLGRPKPKK
jgi:hypothetical protein